MERGSLNRSNRGGLSVGSIPVLKPSELTEILSKLGVEVVRQRCSHQQFRDANGRCTTISAHKGRYIAPALLRQEVLYALGLISQSLLQQLEMSCQLSRQP